jgi:hypothetical protein
MLNAYEILAERRNWIVFKMTLKKTRDLDCILLPQCRDQWPAFNLLTLRVSCTSENRLSNEQLFLLNKKICSMKLVQFKNKAQIHSPVFRLGLVSKVHRSATKIMATFPKKKNVLVFYVFFLVCGNIVMLTASLFFLPSAP